MNCCMLMTDEVRRMMAQKKTYEYNTSWDKVTRVFPAGEHLKILDIGCGDGSLTKHLLVNHEVFGIDADHRAVRAAYAAGLQALRGDLEDRLPFQNSHFDVVLALDVLEHVADIDFILNEVRRVLKDTGYFIVSLPNHFDLRTRLEIFFGKGIIRWSQRQYEENAWHYTHLRFLTIPDVRRMLRAHDFRIDREQYNFMSQGLLPTRYMPRWTRKVLVKWWPSLWSGKIVVRARKQDARCETIVVTETPKNF